MLQVTDDMVMIGATEFRSEMPRLLGELSDKKIIVVMKRGKPVAVFQNFEDFQEQEEWMDVFEDLVLGHLAKERDEATAEDDFLSHEEMLINV